MSKDKKLQQEEASNSKLILQNKTEAWKRAEDFHLFKECLIMFNKKNKEKNMDLLFTDD